MLGLRRRLVAGVVGMVVGATAPVGMGGGASATGPPPSAPRLVTIKIPSHGEIASKWLSYRGQPRANVLLPAGYNRHQHYRLIVFLNGLNTDYNWYAQYGLTKPFDHLGAILVMPEGASGWYADWWNDARRADPSWESYELETVLPTILTRYPILPQRRYHALIGISMGGLGATYLGGRLPGFFGSVATLSGFVDPQYKADALQPLMAEFSHAAATGDNAKDPIYGPPRGFYASGHNPTRLANNLEHTRVFETTGTGVPSKADPHPPGFNLFEEAQIIYPMNERYHKALLAAGVDVTSEVHRGGHDLPDFRHEVAAMLRWGLFKPVVNNPASWVNRTVAASGQLWDFNYRFASPPTRVVRFAQSGTTLSISAAGAAVTVTTATGCAIDTPTPATVRLPTRRLVSPRLPERVGHASCR